MFQTQVNPVINGLHEKDNKLFVFCSDGSGLVLKDDGLDGRRFMTVEQELDEFIGSKLISVIPIYTQSEKDGNIIHAENHVHVVTSVGTICVTHHNIYNSENCGFFVNCQVLRQ